MFIIAIIAGVLTLVGVIVGLYLMFFDDTWGERHRTGGIVTIVTSLIVGGAITVGFWVAATLFFVGPGEAKVLKAWSGEVVGSVTTTGAHWTDPWVDAVDFDIKNQTAVFLGDGSQQYGGEPTTGPQITFTDKDGVTANMDLVILYSIDPTVVEELVEDYGGQQGFTTKVIEQDARAVPRIVPGRFTTIEVLTDRAQVTAAIREDLEADWASKGIVVEDVSLQEIRYSESVRTRFEDAQNAQTEIVKAEAEAQRALTAAEGEAAAKVAAAEGEAEANRILDASLTDDILQQRWIDAVKSSSTIIVPESFDSLGRIE